ncbi:MAG: hypothetical protein AW07_00908 [Candidatus Accumulibacter sp. SK-11]|nr:MAG: hypothetical protein AW07_00908 [Candidatus Accumulibacter sp. SK-11]
MLGPRHVEPDIQPDDNLRGVNGNGLFGLVPHIEVAKGGKGSVAPVSVCRKISTCRRHGNSALALESSRDTAHRVPGHGRMVDDAAGLRSTRRMVAAMLVLPVAKR